jgi:hypothetical protein
MMNRCFVIFALAVSLAGCAVKGFAVCCESAEDCNEVGLDEVTACEAGQTCVEGFCVAGTDPLTCTSDAECGSGACLATEGRCATDEEMVFVASTGMDTGDCTSGNPCATIPYALSEVTAERGVLRILGASYTADAGMNIDRDVYIDCDATSVSRNGIGTVVTINTGATVVIEGMQIEDAMFDETSASIAVSPDASLRLFDVDVLRGPPARGIWVNGGTLQMEETTLLRTGVECVEGSIIARRNQFELSGAVLQTCEADVSRNHFSLGEAQSFQANRGVVRFENNLMTRDALGSYLRLDILAAGSVVRFNTLAGFYRPSFVDGVIRCTGDTPMTSNIIAVQVMGNPHFGNCPTPVATLYDDEADVPGGTLVQAFDDIFVGTAGGDLHPAPGSLALRAGDPNGPAEDFEGAARPQPAATLPDIGALESP